MNKNAFIFDLIIIIVGVLVVSAVFFYYFVLDKDKKIIGGNGNITRDLENSCEQDSDCPEIQCIRALCLGNKCVDNKCQMFCGISTLGSCNSDSQCKTGGCSGQVCQGVDEEDVITTCEYKDCYNSASFDVSCGCVDNKCEWN